MLIVIETDKRALKAMRRAIAKEKLEAERLKEVLRQGLTDADISRIAKIRWEDAGGALDMPFDGVCEKSYLKTKQRKV